MDHIALTQCDRIGLLLADNFKATTPVTDFVMAKEYFSGIGMELRIFQSADATPIVLFSLRRDGRMMWLNNLSSHSSLTELWAAWCRYVERLHWHQVCLMSLAELYSSARPKTRRCVMQWVEQLGRAHTHQKDKWPWSSARYCPVQGALVFEGWPWKGLGSCSIPFYLEGEPQSMSSLLHFDPDFPTTYMDSALRILAISDREEICHATRIVEKGSNQSLDVIASRRV